MTGNLKLSAATVSVVIINGIASAMKPKRSHYLFSNVAEFFQFRERKNEDVKKKKAAVFSGAALETNPSIIWHSITSNFYSLEQLVINELNGGFAELKFSVYRFSQWFLTHVRRGFQVLIGPDAVCASCLIFTFSWSHYNEHLPWMRESNIQSEARELLTSLKVSERTPASIMCLLHWTFTRFI